MPPLIATEIAEERFICVKNATECQTLQHNDTNTAHLLLIGKVLIVDTSRDRSRPIIVQIVVKLAITCTEFELLQEQRVVVQGQCVEYIEFSLRID